MELCGHLSHMLLNYEVEELDVFLTFCITLEEGLFIAECPELKISDFGETEQEAKEHLYKVVQNVIEDAVNNDKLVEMLTELGFHNIRNEAGLPHIIYGKLNGKYKGYKVLELHLELKSQAESIRDYTATN